MSKPKPLTPAKYWAIVAEIDATIFCIEQVAKQQVGRKPIELMVDKATGYDKEQTQTLEYWSARLTKLVAKIKADDELTQRLSKTGADDE